MDQLLSNIREIFSTNEFIPLHVPKFIGNEKEYVLKTIESTVVSSTGEYVNEVERLLVQLTKTEAAAAVVNGTAGLQVSLKIAGVSYGSEVLTQSLTFVATANAIAQNGASPIFIDVDLDTLGMSPEALENWLEENAIRDDVKGTFNKKTKARIAACLPVHIFGFICRIDKIIEICNNWDIPVIEDSSEALGSTYQGRSAGSWGQMGVFSFNGNKIVTSGGGGAIVSNNGKWAMKAKYITNTAKRPHEYEYFHDEIGYNYRMPNLNAALLTAQLQNLNQFIENKKELYEDYRQLFTAYGLNLIEMPRNQEWNYWLFGIIMNSREERDLFLKETNNNGIMTRPIWQLMHKLPMYSSCQRDSQENSKFLEDRVVNLPSSARIKTQNRM